MQASVDGVTGHALVGLTSTGLVRRPGKARGAGDGSASAAAGIASGFLME